MEEGWIVGKWPILSPDIINLIAIFYAPHRHIKPEQLYHYFYYIISKSATHSIKNEHVSGTHFRVVPLRKWPSNNSTTVGLMDRSNALFRLLFRVDHRASCRYYGCQREQRAVLSNQHGCLIDHHALESFYYLPRFIRRITRALVVHDGTRAVQFRPISTRPLASQFTANSEY